MKTKKVVMISVLAATGVMWANALLAKNTGMSIESLAPQFGSAGA